MMELLAPAGGYEALIAAVQSGADAVYMGFGAFNARRSAKNFTDEEFASAVDYCHLRGVRVFLTLNTLLTDRELDKAADTLRKASAMGVDAVLVQDWGLLTQARETVPDLPIHASTQMSLFTLGGAREAEKLGMERVVLARELSRDEVAEICAGCGAEIEIFGHGALCMCYSGQCEMSAVLGQRSGNRGACAQPCRLPYGVNAPCGADYPLSLKDANLSAYLQDMERMGVACLKIEGRMKRPEYVAVVTGIYRRLLDEKRRPTAAESAALEQAFSRSGFTDGYWLGRKGRAMFGTRPENAPEPKELFAQARAVYENGKENRKIPVNLRMTVRRGEPVRLSGACAIPGGVTIGMATGDMPEEARNRAVTEEELLTAIAEGTFTLAGRNLTAHCNDAESFLLDWASHSENNLLGYENSAYDTLMSIIANAPDGTARLGCLHDAEELLMADAPLTPLYTTYTAWTVRETLTGVIRDPRGWFSFCGALRRQA